MKNKYIRKVLCKIFMTSLVLIGSSYGLETKAISKYWDGVDTKVMYSAHVQDIGWQYGGKNGDLSGTTGQVKNLESIQIKVDDSAPFNIEYTVQVNGGEWVEVRKNGQIAGTVGKNIPITNMCIAIKDKSNNEDSVNYDVYYRLHIRNIGWSSWVKNGSIPNSTTNVIEAYEVQIRPKGVGIVNSNTDSISYSAHVQDIGWQSSVSNNMTSGTTGMNKKVEAIKIANNTYSPYDIEYTTYSKVNGWSDVSKNGEISGTTGQNIPLTNMCIAIKDKEDRKYFAGYDVYYRVHVSDYGWRPWVRNGSLANDTDKTIEAFEIKMVENGVKENIVIEEPVISEEIDDDVFDDYDINGLITLLKAQLGKPYVYGAAGPNAFDCSGLTSYVYKNALGIDIGRTTYDQLNAGIEVSQSELKVGDLVFPHSGHVGIYIGNGQMIHAPQTGDVVKISPVYKFWKGVRVIY